MANAPSHSQNSAIKIVTIFNADGEKFEVSRLNAVDLIRGGGYFWKPEDATKDRPEADGPADPTAKVQTVYNAAGEPFEVDSVNARDMINTGAYFWNTPTPTDKGVEAPSEEPTIENSVEPTPAPSAETDVVPAEEGLLEQAERVTGTDDVIAYLEGFAEQALRDMANERYGEKLHHRASKSTLIEKIVELEDARTVGADQAEA